MKLFYAAASALAVLMTVVTVGQSQGMLAPSGPSNLSGKMAPVFGNRSFTATMQTVVKNSAGQETTMKMSQAVLDGNTRSEMNVGDMKGGSVSPQAAAQMKKMGFDRTITIFNADDHTTTLIYPGLKSYTVLKPDTAMTGKPKIEKTELGKETIEGHPTVKTKVIITPTEGSPQEVIVWEATDLHNFPVKTVMQSEGSTITTTYHDINQKKPDGSLFKAPEGYQKYDNMQEMMMGAMQQQIPADGK